MNKPLTLNDLTISQLTVWAKRKQPFVAQYSPVTGLDAAVSVASKCELVADRQIISTAIGVVTWSDRQGSGLGTWHWKFQAEEAALRLAIINRFNPPCPQQILAELEAVSPSRGLTRQERIELLRGKKEEEYID